MGECVAHRYAERPQPEGLRQDACLVADADRGVGEVGVVEAHAGIEQDPVDAEGARALEPGPEVVEQARERVVVERDRREVANVGEPHEAEHDRGVVLRREGEHLVLVLATGHVEDPGAGGEAGADDGRLVGLHGHHGLVGECLDDGDERRDLVGRVDALGAGRARLGTDVDDMGTLGDLDAALADRGRGRDRDALAVGRAAGQVDGPHQRGRVVADHERAHLHRRDGRVEVAAIGVPQGGQVVERDHRGKSRAPHRRTGRSCRRAG